MEQSQITFCITCPLKDAKKVSVVGSVAELGLWQPEKGLELVQENEKWINKQVLALDLCSEIEFKLCLWQQGNEQVQWEPLPNNCNHKIQIISKTMVLELEYGKTNILNTFQSLESSSDNQTEVKELKMKYEKSVNDNQAKELSSQKEISELKNALQNEKKNSQDSNKVRADLEDKIKKVEQSLQKAEQSLQQKEKESSQARTEMEQKIKSLEATNQQKDKDSNQLQTAQQQEIAKLQKSNDEYKQQLEKANANADKETKENANNKIQIEKLNKEITEMKAASSKQAPQATEQVTKEQISVPQESPEQPAAESKKSKKNKKGGNKQQQETTE